MQEREEEIVVPHVVIEVAMSQEAIPGGLKSCRRQVAYGTLGLHVRPDSLRSLGLVLKKNSFLFNSLESVGLVLAYIVLFPCNTAQLHSTWQSGSLG